MEDGCMSNYRERLAEFFYPFLANVELGNISALNNTRELVDAYMSYAKHGYFAPPNLDGAIQVNSEVSMKFEELPDNIQLAAALTISQHLLKNTMQDELAISVASSIKKAFITLYEEGSVTVEIGDVEIKTI